MAKYRSRQFDPHSKEPLPVSRSKIEVFTQCPRCAYLDLRLGVKRIMGPPFTLNNAVDHLLKKEFDVHRVEKGTHPLMEQYNIDAIPYEHKDLEKWRHNFTGVRYVHEKSGFEVFGAVDDIWINPKGELYVVDYKATAKNEGPTTTDDLYDSYKKQMEIYQWLLRRNDFDVSDIGYFVYANGRRDEKAFDGKLEFDVVIIPYEGDDSWVEPTLSKMREVLSESEMPPIGKSFDGQKPCEYCTYREVAGTKIRELYTEKKNIKTDKKETLF